MPRPDCQVLARNLAEPLRDLGFMLSCYDVYSGPPPGRAAASATEAPQHGDGE